MKVIDVKAIILSVKLPEPVMDANYIFPSRSCVLIKVSTDEGIVGIGEACCIGGPPITTKIIVEEELSSYIIGEDPSQVERLWDTMYRRSIQHGRKGAVIAAISGIDIALWDIRGKICNLPIYKILGNYSPQVPAYASGGFYAPGKDTSALVDEMSRYVADGFKTVKMKIGRLSVREDMARVRAVREAIGDEISFIVDANCKYLPSTAIRVGKELQDYDVLCFEEPISADDIEGYVKVAAALDMPIAAGESEFCKYGFRDLIRSGAVDIVQPDVTWSGGLTECKKIAAIAEAWNIPCMPHGFSSAINLVATMHLVGAIPNGMFVEFDQNYNPLRSELIEEGIKLGKNGLLEIPSKPGLGITLNDDTIEKYSVDI